ncbi:MAG: DUF445 domain-containing protein [Frankiaceae bacterium]|nr:DUF445 domain-containing protein [Frankiaceae bacterium]
MKGMAGGLLVIAATIFVICVCIGNNDGAWGYVQAGAEAAMVGGLADWFAVTALFRHPLGIPIPHTAIIPRKKDSLGKSLGTFVQQNFVNADIVTERLAATQIPHRVGVWLADSKHAAALADEIGAAVDGMTALLRDDELRNAVAEYADKHLRELDLAAPSARIIDAICDSGQHQAALTSGLRALIRFLDDNRNMFRQQVAERSPSWVPNWVDKKVFDNLFRNVQAFLADVTEDTEHELRARFDSALRQYAALLRTDPEKIAALDRAKLTLLEHPAVRSWLSTLWLSIKAVLVNGANDPNSGMRSTIAALIERLGRTLGDDENAQARIDRWIQRATTHLIARHADDLAEFISGTVARWDTKETSRRIELQVGRDLQFIRVNGTLVGAVVGLMIHAVALLL